MKCLLRYVRERTQGTDRRCGCTRHAQAGAGACVAGSTGAPGPRTRPRHLSRYARQRTETRAGEMHNQCSDRDAQIRS